MLVNTQQPLIFELDVSKTQRCAQEVLKANHVSYENSAYQHRNMFCIDSRKLTWTILINSAFRKL